MSIPTHFGTGDGFEQLSEDFMVWLKRCPGFTLNPSLKIVDLRLNGAGRGVIACQDINEDEELFVIPENLILSVQNSKAKELLRLDDEGLGPWLSLIIVLIYEYLQGEGSQWATYFRVLPTDFDTLMFWTEEELRELQGSAVVGKVGKADADQTLIQNVLPLILKHPHLFPPIHGLSSFDSPEGKNILLSLAHRMGSLIMAYAFDMEKSEDVEAEDGYITDDEEEPAKGMVPLADLLNADADRNNARLFQEDGTFVMKAIKPIRAGEEIYNDYGELPSADLVRRYGYVTPNYTQYDVVELSLLSICQAAGLCAGGPIPSCSQLELLEDLDILEDGYSISRLSADEPLEEVIPEDLVILLRTLTLPLEEINRLKSKGKPPKPAFGFEEAALLSTAVAQRQAEYTTSIQEDQWLLSQSPDAATMDKFRIRRRQMAIQVRKGEKEILAQLLERLQDSRSVDARNGTRKRTAADTASQSKKQRTH